MKTFTHTIQNDFAMHFGPIGRLASIADCYPDTVGTLMMGNRSAEMSRPMRMATMGIRKGDAVTVSVEGPSEVEMFDVLCNYFNDVM